MLGYLNRPDETADVLRDGWFRTGDIGAFDEDGYLRLTDRKKEILVTSGGKNIAPQPIEQRLRAHPLVAEAVLVGDRRHFAAALLVPDLAALGAALGLAPAQVGGRLQAPEVQALFQQVVDQVNLQLAQFERVKKFVLIADEVSMASGLLTPTLKVKRRVFEERFRAEIDVLYQTPSAHS
jgi:long-chain acyl-CoA synthetase